MDKKLSKVIRDSEKLTDSGSFGGYIQQHLDKLAEMAEKLESDEDIAIDDFKSDLFIICQYISFSVYSMGDIDFEKTLNDYVEQIKDSKLQYAKWFAALK